MRREDKKELAQDVRDLLSPDDVNYTKEMAYQSVIDLARKWQYKYKSLSYKILNMEWPPYLTYLDYNVKIRRMLYTTNWIERFNRSARRTLKVRGAFPNEESVLALITSTAIDKSEKMYKYPIHNFNLEPKLKKYNG